MALFDFPLPQLEAYLPERQEPEDFDRFWQETLAESRRVPLEPSFEPVDFGLVTVQVYDVTFQGYLGQPVKAWLLLPDGRPGPLPCIVQYIGYGGGRSNPFDWLTWSAAGFAHLVMDTRGQGSASRRGDTVDLNPHGAGPHFPGFLTHGIESPERYYYRRLYVDAVRAVETARLHPRIDAGRVAVTGGSQGGGLSLAVSGLAPDVWAVMADVPFLCHFRRATEITDAMPYREIAVYCQVHRNRVEEVFHTLSYFDGLNFVKRANAPALFSVGLMDEVCPPSTVFAAYNHYCGPKQIRVYRFNHHEGGGSDHDLEKIRFIKGHWGV